MTTIIDWLGKADDLTITYDAVMHQNNQIPEGIIEEFSKQSDEMDKDQKKEIKTKVKVAKKSIKYLKRCAEALQKVTKGIDVEVEYLLLPESESTND